MRVLSFLAGAEFSHPDKTLPGWWDLFQGYFAVADPRAPAFGSGSLVVMQFFAPRARSTPTERLPLNLAADGAR